MIPMTTTVPIPVPGSSHSLVLFGSIALNLILIIALITLIVYYLKLRKENKKLQAEIQARLRSRVTVNQLTGQVGPFSLGSILGSMQDLLNEPDEEQPLISNRFENIGCQGLILQEVHSNSSSVSDDTFLRHRTDYGMRTFKPSAPQEDRNATNESSV